MKEIGSEFWPYAAQTIIQDISINKHTAYLLSGRTALDFVIRDIKTSRRFNSVMLPSFCCESIIEPFERNGVKVQFYRVYEQGIDYMSNDADAVLLLDYFGFQVEENIQIADEERAAGKLIIYDLTHKLNGSSVRADYTFCSYRKWLYCNFAIATKVNGIFDVGKPTETNYDYCRIRDKAADLKAKYMAEESIDKEEFLHLFGEAEYRLNTDYVGYSGLPVVIDKESIISARQRNAKRLIDGLQDINGIRLWRTFIDKKDTPLFVPILIENGKRDKLRKYLSKNDVYCPVHWPLSYRHGTYTDLYAEELSLICDQRYSIADMDRQIDLIKNFLKEET